MTGFAGVAYCDLAVGNADHSAEYFCRRYGFGQLHSSGTRAGKEELNHLLGRGRVQLVVGSSIRPAGKAATFVRDHGEGVRDIGLVVADPERAWHEAVRRGATPSAGATAIDVLGAYQHTFVSEQYDAGTDQIFGHIDHLAVAVPYGTLDKWTDFYVTALGFDVVMKEITETGRSSMGSSVVRHESTGATFTLLAPGRPDDRSQINEFLTFNGGPGVQHIAFSTSDIFVAVDELARNGVEFLTTPDSYYEPLGDRVPALRDQIAAMRERGILADRDEGGELLQIFTRPVTGRPTLFFEVIERRGESTGFGSGNIKALFEAVEAEQRRRGTL